MSREEQRAEVARYWWSKAEDSLASARRDYLALVAFDREYVEAQMIRCEQLLAKLRPLISSVESG